MGETRGDPKGSQYLKDWDFSSRSLKDSFGHAWDGLSYIYVTQRNMRIHVFFAALAVSACILFGVGRTEFFMVTLAILGVLSAEVVNTLTESIVNLIQPEYNIIAKIIKDVAAAGVLLTAVFSVVIGVIAFYPALGNLGEVLEGFLKFRWPYFLVQTVVFLGPSFWGMIKFDEASDSSGGEAL